MINPIATGAVHHLALMVRDVGRSRDFYTGLLSFQLVMELESRLMLSNGGVILVLTPLPDPGQASHNDCLNENRVGLDHLSLRVVSRNELENAIRLLDERGVAHGQIRDLGPDLGLYVLAFRDPSNIQLELTAPYGQTMVGVTEMAKT